MEWPVAGCSKDGGDALICGRKTLRSITVYGSY